MSLIVTLLIGLGIGVMVELLLPGHTASELVLAIFLGMAGAVLARVVGQWGDWFDAEEAANYVAAAVGAIIVLLIYGAFFRRSKSRGGA